jgi:GNAT superfamily N-acetyltransferase
MTFTIRKIPRYDYGIVLDMDSVFFDVAPDIGEHTAWWVAFDESGAPVAYAGAMMWEPDQAMYMHRAAVMLSARGNGLQRRLVRARERWGRANGAALSYTYTSASNLASANNLIRCGYTLWAPSQWCGQRDPARGANGHSWLYWQRRL